MNLNTTPSDSSVFSIKSASFDAIRLLIQQADMATLKQALQAKLQEAGAFFDNDPVVIDVSLIDHTVDWPAVIHAVKDSRLHPIGAIATGANAEAAKAVGIALLDMRHTQPRALPASVETEGAPPDSRQPEATFAKTLTPSAQPTDAVGKVDTVPPSAPDPDVQQFNTPVERTLLLNRPVRSGQRIYARGGDVVVMGFVSRGAEIIADGNVHIYGPLRGRAIAGARGDAGARVFTTHLDAELVAIAGVYRTSENSYPEDVFGRPALVRLVGERLLIEPIAQD